MFGIIGMLHGKEQKIEYSNVDGIGKLSGDKLIVFVVEDAMKSIELTGPVGQYLDRDINNPLAVLFVIRECFDEILSSWGNIPTAAPMPENAR